MWVLEQALRQKFIDLILPETVLDEWDRNREKTLRKERERMTSALRTAKWAVEQVGSKKDKQNLVRQLEDLRKKVPLLGTNPASMVARIVCPVREGDCPGRRVTPSSPVRRAGP